MNSTTTIRLDHQTSYGSAYFFISILVNEEAAINFMLNNQLFNIPVCKCGTNTKLEKYSKFVGGYAWRCTNYKCKNVYSINNSTIFSGMRIRLGEIIYIFFHCFLRGYNNNHITDDTLINKETIWSLKLIYFAVLKFYYGKKFQFGESGNIVEIDESKFKRKFERGRLIHFNGWVFGITERDSTKDIKSLFFVVPNRKKETLYPIIYERISKNCPALMSDCYSTYFSLREEGYQHLMINHKENYLTKNEAYIIPPRRKRLMKIITVENIDVHTQTIESRWKQIKTYLRILGPKAYNNLQEYIWMVQYKLEQKGNLEHFINILKLYINDI